MGTYKGTSKNLIAMSKIRIVLFCLGFTLLSLSGVAQLRCVHLNVKGTGTMFEVSVEGLGEVIVNRYGDIVEIITSERLNRWGAEHKYYSDFNSYEAGKIKSIGDVKFTYYSNFNSYESGKIKTIGDIKFTYYSAFNDYEVAKIKSIGTSAVKYYSNFNDYESGKVKSVEGITLKYHSKFNDYEAGKLKSIATHKYEYYSNFNSHTAGQLKSGNTNLTISGIHFTVRQRH